MCPVRSVRRSADPPIDVIDVNAFTFRELGGCERIKAQDVDVLLERTDSLPEEKKAELKGKCHVRGCGKSVLALRDFNQRYHICGDHIKVRTPSQAFQPPAVSCGMFQPVWGSLPAPSQA